MAKLTFLGGVSEVTGSCHMLESHLLGKLLLDCGMHQGGDDIERMQRESFAFKPKEIDAVILSHAHLDHSGLLPKLVHEGFTGPIHCTNATKELVAILLKDSQGLYERDIERENLRKKRAGRRELEPAYDADDVEQVLKQCVGHAYHEDFSPASGVRCRFLDAGHILGSAIVQLVIDEDGTSKTLVFSGDLGNSESALMRDPEHPDRADVVLMESTYGDRDHRPMDETIEQLADILHETWQRHGNVLIPSFAVERTQEILFHLGLLYDEGRLDNWQVFLDSPMAIHVTRVYDHWIKWLDQSDIRELNPKHRASLEKFLPRLTLCETVDDSMSINRVNAGAIIIAGSGMCTGGRIRHHIKHRIWVERNSMLFIGYQAHGTLGRILVDGAKRIRLFREQYVVRARIETLGGFSAHAGQRALMAWMGAIDGKQQVALVHGEPQALEELHQKLWQEQQLTTTIPERGDSLVI